MQPGPPSKSLPKWMPADRLLADSGYAGEAVTLMAPRQVPALKTWGDVTIAAMHQEMTMGADCPPLLDPL
jgi:hypothetical protein